MNYPHPNAVKFSPSTREGHVESYFLKANDSKGERAIWIRATIFASTREPDRPIVEGWAVAFDRRGGVAHHVAVKHSLRYEAASFGHDGLDVRWTRPVHHAGVARRENGSGATAAAPRDELVLESAATHGSISQRDQRIAWDLRFEDGSPPLIPFPYEAMYDAPFPRVKTCTPSPNARFDGYVTVCGERWSVDGWRGMQGHNWGRGHAELYAWCHASTWEGDDDFVLEAMSARVRVGPVLAPLATLVCVRHRGVAYDFNTPLDVARATGDVGSRRFELASSNKRARIEATLEGDLDDFVGLYYPNPDGPMTYCLNTKLARARVSFEAQGQPRVSLTSRAAALEIGTRNDAHGVRMYI